MKHWNSIPANQAIHKAGCKTGARNRLAKPEEVEKLRAGMHKLNQNRTPDVIAKITASRDRTLMGWCPDEWRVTNDKMRRNGVRLDERKRVIAAAIAKAEADRIAALSPFERQLERVRNGAKLIELRPMPRGEHAFSLTGSSMAAL